MVDYLLRSYFPVLVLVIVSINGQFPPASQLSYSHYFHLLAGGETQVCNEWIIISTPTTELIINTTINRTCLQCLDNGTNVPDRWDIYYFNVHIRPSNNDGPIEGFEVVNGTLVLLNPMAVITEGKTNIPLEVECIANSMILAAKIYSSGNQLKHQIVYTIMSVYSLHPTCSEHIQTNRE